MSLLITVAALLFVSWALTGHTPSPPRALSDAEIRGILIDRIDKYCQSVGIVVGIIEPAGQRIICYGQLDQMTVIGISAERRRL